MKKAQILESFADFLQNARKLKKQLGGRILEIESVLSKKHRLSPSGIPCFDEKAKIVFSNHAAGF